MVVGAVGCKAAGLEWQQWDSSAVGDAVFPDATTVTVLRYSEKVSTGFSVEKLEGKKVGVFSL